jgi:hypothetical protein
MNLQNIANRLVELCREGKWGDAQKELFADNAISLEPNGAPAPRIEGLEGIIQKGKQFNEMTETIHSIEVSAPMIADNFISVSMKIDCDMKGMGRQVMEEICIYKIENEKIVSEQFFYTPVPMPVQQ